jgi:hypothetical protein
MIFGWAADPTRDTLIPRLIAGRIPSLNRDALKNSCPSVIEMTFVGMYAETSPSWVSTIGNAVIDPPPRASFSLAPRSSSLRRRRHISLYPIACLAKSSSCLTVSNDELALPTSNRNHRIYRSDPSRKGFVDRPASILDLVREAALPIDTCHGFTIRPRYCFPTRMFGTLFVVLTRGSFGTGLSSKG